VLPADGAPATPEPAIWDVENDALAHALSWLTHHHGRERSPESLLAGLPLAGRLAPDQALRALRDAGYNAGLVQRRVADLHQLLLPAILLLKESDACVVVARRDDLGAGVYDIVMPGRQHHACTATEAELDAEYTGLALVATPQPANEQAQAPSLMRAEGSHWLWGTVRRFIPYYRGALLASLLSNVLVLVTGMATSVIYDKVIPHQAYVTLWALALGAALAVSFDLMSRQLRTYLIDMAGRKANLIVGSLLFRQTLGMRMEHRPVSAGAYAHHLGQLETVREFFASATLSAISDLPFILIFVGMTFMSGGPLGWVLVVGIPLLMGMSALIQGALRRAMSSHMQQQADLHGVLVEAVDGMEDIKAAGAQGRFLRKYEESTATAASAMLRSRNISSWTMNIASVTQQIVTMVMLVWGVYLIDEKVITGGALIGAVMYASRALAPLASVTALATRYQGARAAMRALDAMMTKPVDREPGKVYVPKRELSGRLTLNDVGFSYPVTEAGGHGPARQRPQPEGPRVLKGLNLQIQPGERIAVLGRIGSGKSTVLRLLAGLYLPSEGQVEADGIDLRQIDPADYRARVGFVAQDPRLFNGTLRDNVLLDRPSADPARLGDVARLTGLDRLVSQHPQGWELPVGESGALLSGGQRQLVALARCLVTRPQVLLMDEPTSSMDAQSEVAFLRQLKEACGSCTLVMVTHRPAVLELVSRIVVVDSGRVVMDGPKAAVLAALSGQRPAMPPQQPQQPAAAAPSNLHLHPTARTVEREASV
jgi:ATP-binding cassette subfamily C protein LapB